MAEICRVQNCTENPQLVKYYATFIISSFHSEFSSLSILIFVPPVSAWLLKHITHPSFSFLLASARRLIYLLLAFSLWVEWMIITATVRVYESGTELSRNRIYELLFTQWRSSIRNHGENAP